MQECVSCNKEVTQEESITCLVGSVVCHQCNKREMRVKFEDLIFVLPESDQG